MVGEEASDIPSLAPPHGGPTENNFNLRDVRNIPEKRARGFRELS